MPQKLPDLKEDDLQLGCMYRGKKPITLETTIRSLFDDRIITWINPDRTVIQYDGPGVPEGVNKPTLKFSDFLYWASHELTGEVE